MKGVQAIGPVRVNPTFVGCTVVTSALLAGCGNIPKAQVNYYLATTTMSVQVIRSVLCNKANSPVVATTVTPTVTHQADVTNMQKLDLNWFRAPLSDADVKVELFDDGRLKSVNAISTGQGEAVVKATVLLMGKTIDSAQIARNQSQTDPETLCKTIENQNGGDPILVVYSGLLTLDENGSVAEIKPEATSQYFASLVEPLIGKVCATVSKSPKAPAGQLHAGDEFKDRSLMVRQPGWADGTVSAAPLGKDCTNDLKPPLFSWRAAVAQFGGKTYGVPVPKPAIFGKQSIGLVFAESGALTSLQYTSGSGAGEALSGLNALMTAAKGGSPAEKAAELTARADLIAAQQRLVLCTATPAACTKP